MRLILASNSKARKDIFNMIGWKYEVFIWIMRSFGG